MFFTEYVEAGTLKRATIRSNGHSLPSSGSEIFNISKFKAGVLPIGQFLASLGWVAQCKLLGGLLSGG